MLGGKILNKIVDWIKNHKTTTLIVCIVMFFLPPVLVHVLFKWNSGIDWLSAEWSAGDILAYIAGFEAFIGTIVLGFVTVYQSGKASRENERLSRENNFLQRISVQRLLPLVSVESITIDRSCITTKLYSQDKASTVEVADTVTPEKRETHLRTYLPRLGSQIDRYYKTVKLTIKNISDSAIRQISVERIEFSGFKYQDEIVNKVCCIGTANAKYISWLLLPKKSLEITVDIFFDNKLYKKFWEFEDISSIGDFDMCLYITNKSLSGIECVEKIYINKAVNFKERVMYKVYEEDISNA